MKLHRILDDARERANLSLADLARRTDIPRQNLGTMLAGSRPIRASHLFLIVGALGMGDRLDFGAFVADYTPRTADASKTP